MNDRFYLESVDTLVAITTFKRKALLKYILRDLNKAQKLPTWIFNDDTEDLSGYLFNLFDLYFSQILYKKIDLVARQRCDLQKLRAVKEFLKSSYSYLLLLDDDIILDPNWLNKARIWYEDYKLPISLFNHPHHQIFRVQEFEEVRIHSQMSGPAVFFSRLEAERIIDFYLSKDDLYISRGSGWDWAFASILGNQVICPKQSYAEQIPSKGINKHTWSYNPTDYLFHWKTIFKPNLVLEEI